MIDPFGGIDASRALSREEGFSVILVYLSSFGFFSVSTMEFSYVQYYVPVINGSHCDQALKVSEY
jgi:hypothetical protein